MDLEVIGAGLGRTGTTSLKLALEQLELTPCHHMSVAHAQSDKMHLWERVANGDLKALKTLFEGFRSTLDYPGCMHFETFMEWNPNAKVILTVRDSAEAWEESARKTIMKVSWFRSWALYLVYMLPFTNLYYFQFIQNIAREKHGKDLWSADTDLKVVYNEWIEHVKSVVPADKLLIYNVKQGWAPLCGFLGMPVPDTPFPRSNDADEFQNMKKMPF